MPRSTWITAITSKGKVCSDRGDTSAVISVGDRAPVPTSQTLTPRAWLVFYSPHHPVSQLEGCSQTPFPCSLFAEFPLVFKPKSHQGFLCELCTGGESGSARRGLGKHGGVGGVLPAHLNLAKFLSNSCFSRWKSWMYFIWGHKATPEVERDVSTRNGQEDTPLSTWLGIPPPREGLKGSTAHRMVLQRVSSLPKIQQLGISPLRVCQQPWTFPGQPRVKVGPHQSPAQALPSPGGQTSALSIFQSLSLCPWPRTHSRACAPTLALNTDPPKGKATIQVRQEEMDQRTDPTSLHPTDPGNQDRKSQGSLTGLTGLNEHLASPMESWIKPLPGRA